MVVRLSPQAAWGGSTTQAMTYGQLLATLLVYFLLQPRVALGLLSRAHHALPFVLVCLIGAAMHGPLVASTLWHVALLYYAAVVATVLNDHYDRAEDARQGRPAYLDGEDVAVLTTVFLFCVATLMVMESVVGWIQLLLFVVSVLYSHPAYRAKRYFPANLKIEGVWGAGAFLVGIVAGVDGAPSVAAASPSTATAAFDPSAAVTGAFDASTLTALALVFAGWSLVAALKDYKDLRTDARAGIQTVYTLAVRRGWGLRTVHRRLSVAVALALLVPFPLLAWERGWPALTAGVGVPFAATLLLATSRPPSRAGFRAIVGTISLLLASVLARLLVE